MSCFTWTADGESNKYHVQKANTWVAAIQLNGVYTVHQQYAMMDTIVNALEECP